MRIGIRRRVCQPSAMARENRAHTICTNFIIYFIIFSQVPKETHVVTKGNQWDDCPSINFFAWLSGSKDLLNFTCNYNYSRMILLDPPITIIYGSDHKRHGVFERKPEKNRTVHAYQMYNYSRSSRKCKLAPARTDYSPNRCNTSWTTRSRARCWAEDCNAPSRETFRPWRLMWINDRRVKRTLRIR